MNKFLAVMMAAAFVSTAGLAAAQRVDSEINGGWVGDEPNTPAPSSLPFCFPMDPRKPGHLDPSCDYPADSNGLGEERSSTGSAGTILSVTWMTASDVGLWATSAITRNLGQSMIVPGLGQFRASYGDFQDLNDDGWIDQGSTSAAAVSLRGGCTQETHLGDDDNGLGAADPAGGERINSGFSVRCDRDVEWTAGPATTIVAYVTPGDYNGNADIPNGPRGFINNDTSTPDFTFQGTGNGQYFAPSSAFDYVVIDNSLLETSVIEAISNPKTVLDGERTAEAQAGSLVEVDVHTSLNPALESLYETNVIAPLNSVGCDVDWTTTTNACPMTQDLLFDTFLAALDDAEGTVAGVVDPIVDPVVEDACAAVAPACETEAPVGVPQTDPTVGPIDDQTTPPWEDETGGQDWSSPHIYFDQRLVAFTTAVSGGVTHLGDSSFTSTALGDGKYRPAAQSSLNAIVGIWTDKNGDGVIGVYEEDGAEAFNFLVTDDDGCPDRHDCGLIDDPHDYDDTNEFQPACGAKQTTEGDKAEGVYITTLTSSTGSWGSGVWVLTDRREPTALIDPEDEGDGLMDDGRSPFNPYDDILVDASDGSIDSTIVTSGPIQVHMLCHDGSGAYTGYERLIFLDGTNQGYDIEVTATVAGDFTAEGVPVGETRTDVDTYAAFNL